MTERGEVEGRVGGGGGGGGEGRRKNESGRRGSESVTHNINNNVPAHQKLLQGQLVLDLVLPMVGHLGD